MYDAKASIVFDNGTGTLKVGFGGNESPTHILPSYVSIPKHRGSMFAKKVTTTDNLAAGDKAVDQAKTRDFKLRCPLEYGIVKSFKDMTALWERAYDLLSATSSDHAVLLTEPPSNPMTARNEMVKTFFEKFEVPSLFIGEQATLALYASGRTTGVVLDSGEGVTHCVPIFEGFDLPHAVVRLPVAGKDVTKYLISTLKKTGIHFHSSSEILVVQDLKEKVCCVRKREEKTEEKDEPVIFSLPDGKKIQIGRRTRESASEVLFDPSLIGLEFGGIHECVNEAIGKTGLDTRRELYSTVVLSGGTTMLKGFGARLLSELRALTDTKVKIFAPANRHLSAWIGGSIICGLNEENSFKEMWISKEQYKEQGLNLR